MRWEYINNIIIGDIVIWLGRGLELHYKIIID